MYFLLSPLQITLYIFRRLHALRKVRSRFRQPCPRLSLQSKKFAILRIELPRHLRLSRQILVERYWIVCLRESVIHIVEEIDTRGAARRLVVAAPILT